MVIPSGVTNYPTLSAVASANNLTINSGASLSTNGYTLTIAGGLTNAGTFLVTSGSASVTGSVANSGTLTVRAVGQHSTSFSVAAGMINSSGSTLNLGWVSDATCCSASTLTVTGGTLQNAGAISVSGSGCACTLTATLDNQAGGNLTTVDVALTINGASAAHANAGAIAASGGDITVTNTGGSFANTGTVTTGTHQITFNGGGFAPSTGSMSGTIILTNESVTGTGTFSNGSLGSSLAVYLENATDIATGASITNQATLWIMSGVGNATAHGSLTNQGTLNVRSLGQGHVSFSAAAGLTNSSSGTINLQWVSDSTCCGGATLSVSGGALQNAGAISVSGTGCACTLTATLDNQAGGSLTTVDVGLTIDGASAAHSNAGAISAAGGDISVTNSSGSFSNSGTITTGTHQLTINGGSFSPGSGSIAGNLVLSGVSVTGTGSLTAGSLGSPLSVRAENSTDIAAGANITNQGTMYVTSGYGTASSHGAFTNAGTLLIQAVGQGSQTFTAAAGLTNTSSGTIDLQEINNGTCCAAATLSVSGGALHNAGTISVSGSGCSCYLTATLDNQAGGSLTTVDAPLNINGAGAAHTNAGTINVSGADVGVSSEASFTNSGTINVASGRIFSFGVTLINSTGGILSGAGDISGSVSNTGGTVSPGGAGVAGSLTIDGSYTQGSAGTLSIDIGGLTAGSQYDRLVLGSSSTLDGTLSVAGINSYSPSVGNTFGVLTSTSLSGTFATVNSTIGAVLLAASYSAGGVTLTGQTAPTATPTPTPTATSSPTSTPTNTATATFTSTSTPSPTAVDSVAATATPSARASQPPAQGGTLSNISGSQSSADGGASIIGPPAPNTGVASLPSTFSVPLAGLTGPPLIDPSSITGTAPEPVTAIIDVTKGAAVLAGNVVIILPPGAIGGVSGGQVVVNVKPSPSVVPPGGPVQFSPNGTILDVSFTDRDGNPVTTFPEPIPIQVQYNAADLGQAQGDASLLTAAYVIDGYSPSVENPNHFPEGTFVLFPPEHVSLNAATGSLTITTQALGSPLSVVTNPVGYVQTLKPDTDIGSSFDPSTSQSFGKKAQFSYLQVAEPQIGSRFFVLDPETGNYAYVNAADVGPSGPPPSSSTAVVRGLLDS